MIEEVIFHEITFYNKVSHNPNHYFCIQKQSYFFLNRVFSSLIEVIDPSFLKKTESLWENSAGDLTKRCFASQNPVLHPKALFCQLYTHLGCHKHLSRLLSLQRVCKMRRVVAKNLYNKKSHLLLYAFMTSFPWWSDRELKAVGKSSHELC